MEQQQIPENAQRVRNLRKLARSAYDKQLITQAVEDGLDDDQIQSMLGYPEGRVDRQEHPGSYDVEDTEAQDDSVNPNEDNQPVKEDRPANPNPQTEGKEADSHKEILGHLAGLLTHLSKNGK